MQPPGAHSPEVCTLMPRPRDSVVQPCGSIQKEQKAHGLSETEV